MIIKEKGAIQYVQLDNKNCQKRMNTVNKTRDITIRILILTCIDRMEGYEVRCLLDTFLFYLIPRNPIERIQPHLHNLLIRQFDFISGVLYFLSDH